MPEQRCRYAQVSILRRYQRADILVDWPQRGGRRSKPNVVAAGPRPGGGDAVEE
jgi:hypothetical protein